MTTSAQLNRLSCQLSSEILGQLKQALVPARQLKTARAGRPCLPIAGDSCGIVAAGIDGHMLKRLLLSHWCDSARQAGCLQIDKTNMPISAQSCIIRAWVSDCC